MAGSMPPPGSSPDTGSGAARHGPKCPAIARLFSLRSGAELPKKL
jgi:hypothetical protein